MNADRHASGAIALPEEYVRQVLKGRDARCLAVYDRARLAVSTAGSILELSEWCEIVANLLEASLSIRMITQFLEVSEHWVRWPVSGLLAIGVSANRIGRLAGSNAAGAVLNALADNTGLLLASVQLNTVVGSFVRLAKDAPESIGPVSMNLTQLLRDIGAVGLEDWVSVGLRTNRNNSASRLAYFSGQGSLSLEILQQNQGEDVFFRVEKRLKMGLSALWDKHPALRRLNGARRASLAGGVLGFPRRYVEASGEAADTLYWAAMAHAGAHMRFSCGPYPVGSLKPLQVALISVIEDTRVEVLAAKEMPGLAKLWRVQHRAESTGASTIEDLLARLGRALIDPTYTDNHSWIVKSRKLFEQVIARLDDPVVGREIGSLLGNDLGQMRLQFDARNYIVEPAYRDDNLGIWDFGPQPDAPTEEINIASESVRVERRTDDIGKPDVQSREEAKQSAKSRGAATDNGVVAAKYPEWDHTTGRLRPEWATILEVEPSILPAGSVPERNDVLVEDITRLARAASIGRRRRLRGLFEGDSIDIDAAVVTAIERKMGRVTDSRIFQRSERGHRDLSVLLLLDLSRSTSEKDRHGRSALEVQRQAAAILAEALENAGDTLAIHGFNSDGRDKVRYQRIKGFDEIFSDHVRRKLAALSGEYSTRLGTAIRHAGKLLSAQRAFRRVLLILTDGEPSDIDSTDVNYLTEDARYAVASLRRGGLDVLAFGLGTGPFEALDRIVEKKRVLVVPRLDLLPKRILQLYSELKK